MTQDRDLGRDDELTAFLDGRGDLARRLQAMPQPEPPASLDAAILARVSADLAAEAAQAAANDDLPGPGRPGLLARWRMPLALAASLLGCLFLLLQWPQPDGPEPTIVAQAPQAAPPETTDATVAARPSTAAARPPAPATAPNDTAVAGLESAPTDWADARPAMPAAAPVATPVTTVAAPVAAATAPVAGPAVDSERAQAWLALIDEMLKAELRQDALAEWQKFRAAYPDYPAPERLTARIEALQKR